MATIQQSCGNTKDNENFCRYIQLISKIGRKLFIKFVNEYIASNNLGTFNKFLSSTKIKQQVQELLKDRIIHQRQYSIVYPNNSNCTDLEQWDITLFACIIKKIFNTLSSGERKAIEDIRNWRNATCHGNTSITDVDYLKRKLKFEKRVTVLLARCNDSNFDLELKNEINQLHSDPLDTRTMFEIVTKHNEENKVLHNKIDTVLEKIEKILHIHVNDQKRIERGEHYLQILEEQETNRKKSLEKENSIQTRCKQNTGNIYRPLSIQSDEYSTDVDCLPPGILIKIRQLKSILDQPSQFVRTQQFRDLEKILISKGSIVISGKPGEGKTSAAYELMKSHQGIGKCIEINHPSEIDYLEPYEYDFVFMDDIFGKHELDESKINLWLPALLKIQKLLEANAFKLIVTSRDIVLNECHGDIMQFPFFSNKFEMSTDKLSHEEKALILKRCTEQCKKCLSSEDITSCIEHCKSDIGFPYLCLIFASNDEFFTEGPQFFKRYLVVNSNMLNHLKKEKLMSLWYLWAKGGRCKSVDLVDKTEHDAAILQELVTRRKLKTDIEELHKSIAKNLHYMRNVFVTYENGEYRFSHNSIYQSIGLFFYHDGFQSSVISFSTIDFFMECFRPDFSKQRESSLIILTQKVYHVFVERIIKEINKGQFIEEISVHPCLTENIFTELYQLLIKRNVKDFLTLFSRPTFPINEFNFLKGTLISGTFEVNEFLKRIIKRYKCTAHVFSKERCERCPMFNQLYKSACQGKNTVAMALLDFAIIDDTILIDAVKSDSMDIFDSVLKHFRKFKTVLREKIIEKALLKCIELDNEVMFDAIRKELSDRDLGMKAIYIAAKHGRINFLEKSSEIVKLNEYRNRPYVSDYINKTLEELSEAKVYSVLAKYGVLPSFHNILTYVSNDRIYLLYHILIYLEKVSIIDPADFSDVDDEKKNLYDQICDTDTIRDYYISSGVVDPSSFIDKAIEHEKLDKIKKVIQRQIALDIWDPRKEWAKRVAHYSMKSSTTLFKFLIQNGFKPDSETLLNAVKCGDIEIVRLTISEMNDNIFFESIDNLIHRSVIHSLRFSETLDIYHELINGGVVPTESHVYYLVKYKRNTCLKTMTAVLASLSKSEPLSSSEFLKHVLLLSVENPSLHQLMGSYIN